MYQCYLAGPITGLSYGEAVDWREYAKTRLEVLSGGLITALSPMRGKSHLAAERDLSKFGYDYHVLSTESGIMGRDRFDSGRSDLTIFNFLGAKVASVGTSIEIGWMDAFRVPGILVIEDDGSNPHDHAMVRMACAWRVNSLDKALATACKVLLP